MAWISQSFKTFTVRFNTKLTYPKEYTTPLCHLRTEITGAYYAFAHKTIL